MTLFDQLASLSTESVNPRTAGIDMLPAREIVELLNAEDSLVARAVHDELDHVARAAQLVADAFVQGGRLFYVGAGTSGRLGVVDASECPPTYGVPPSMVQAIMAGGPAAVFQSVEGAEDSREEGSKAIRDNGVQAADVVCGIAASGRTPFVLAALAEARRLGCRTLLVSTNDRKTVEGFAPAVDVLICPHVGPEATTGSTRMKSGTAQKMVLNMITTTARVLIGKTYGNLMVDLQLTNEKLRERAKRIVMTIGDVTYEGATSLLEAAGGKVKTALVMVLTGRSREESEEELKKSKGKVRSEK
ncbi:N-acetylmuramic acid 6-phosphate etherase [soil metagenome]